MKLTRKSTWPNQGRSCVTYQGCSRQWRSTNKGLYDPYTFIKFAFWKNYFGGSAEGEQKCKHVNLYSRNISALAAAISSVLLSGLVLRA